MAGVLHKLLHTYTDTAISVTTGLVTSITRFAVQVNHRYITVSGWRLPGRAVTWLVNGSQSRLCLTHLSA